MKIRSIIVAASLLLAGLANTLSGATAGEHYYRHLIFNHDSPVVPYTGIYEISEADARDVAHYEFCYDAKGRVTEIVNKSPEDWHRHPLTHLGAYRTAFTYDGNREIHRFYDKDGNRVKNLREVYEEVYTADASGFRTSLEFFDLAGKPMQSNWNVARYAWEKKGDMLIERRYNLNGELVPLAPTFRFLISGIKFDSAGRFAAHYNLNEKLEVVDDDDGIACYHDLFAANGNLLGLAYFNAKGELVHSPWKFAMIELAYDANGNTISETGIDEKGNFVMRNAFDYDSSGRILPRK
jgi:hypothetical protein